MSESVHYFNLLLGIGAIILQIISLVTLVLLISQSENKYLSFVKNNFIILGFLLALGPALVLVYSEILNYAPCYHCWVQRVFMFPQIFLFTVAWIRRDRNVFWYSWPLLVAGTIDAIYLNYIYYFNPSTDPCDATGVSCVKQYVNELGGYISIPSLALTSFVALLTLLAVVYFYKKE